MDTLVERYYFWRYMKSGWRQLGAGNGYATLEECLGRCDFYITMEIQPNGKRYPWKILKAVEIERAKEFKN